MKKVIIAIGLIFLLNGLATAQKAFSYRYSPGFVLGTAKSDVIDYVIARIKNKYETDEELIKLIRKQKGIRLKNKKKREAFLVKMEADVRQKLKSTNDWSTVHNEIYFEYWVALTNILGDEFMIPGILIAWTKGAKEGSVYLGFTNGRVSKITGNISLSKTFIEKTVTRDDRERFESSIRKNYGSYRYSADTKDEMYCDGTYKVRLITDKYRIAADGQEANLSFYYEPYGRRLTHDAGFGIQSANGCEVLGICLRSVTLVVTDEQ